MKTRMLFLIPALFLVTVGAHAAKINVRFAVFENDMAKCGHQICFKDGNTWVSSLSSELQIKMAQDETRSDRLKFKKLADGDSENYCFRPTFFYDESAYKAHGNGSNQAIRDVRFEIWPFNRCKKDAANGDACPANRKKPFTNLNTFKRRYKDKKTRLWSADPLDFPYLMSGGVGIPFMFKIEVKPKRTDDKCPTGKPTFVSNDPRVRITKI